MKACSDPVATAVMKALAYCRANDWSGYDPYDALNSELFTAMRLRNSRVARIVVTQALKRAPVNIRPLVGIRKTQNPKALALFLASFTRLSRAGLCGMDDLASAMIERLIALRSPGESCWCWGYSFPWQTRTLIVPAGSPNLVCTSFVADALLDAYEANGDSGCLRMAESAATYMLRELFWSDGSAAGFSYPTPQSRTRIHNANFLAAALLCRVHRLTGDRHFLGPALAAARYSVSRQQEDGSWYYGEEPAQQWIDNFHTGYNLCALHAIGRDATTGEFDRPVRRGLAFYASHFIRNDGAPRYFHNRTYPIDIHCAAQSIITLLQLKDLNPDGARIARTVLRWTMTHMWDEQGFFYYRVLRLLTIRTSYMRWSQAWMVLAMSMLLADAAQTARNQREHLPVTARACA
jgi:hypothetical protein